MSGRGGSEWKNAVNALSVFSCSTFVSSSSTCAAVLPLAGDEKSVIASAQSLPAKKNERATAQRQSVSETNEQTKMNEQKQKKKKERKKGR